MERFNVYNIKQYYKDMLIKANLKHGISNQQKKVEMPLIVISRE